MHMYAHTYVGKMIKDEDGKRLFLMIHLFLFYAHWCFDCMFVCMRVLVLEPEFQTVVSCHAGAGN